MWKYQIPFHQLANSGNGVWLHRKDYITRKPNKKKSHFFEAKITPTVEKWFLTPLFELWCQLSVKWSIFDLNWSCEIGFKVNFLMINAINLFKLTLENSKNWKRINCWKLKKLTFRIKRHKLSYRVIINSAIKYEN